MKGKLCNRAQVFFGCEGDIPIDHLSCRLIQCAYRSSSIRLNITCHTLSEPSGALRKVMMLFVSKGIASAPFAGRQLPSTRPPCQNHVAIGVYLHKFMDHVGTAVRCFGVQHSLQFNFAGDCSAALGHVDDIVAVDADVGDILINPLQNGFHFPAVIFHGIGGAACRLFSGAATASAATVISSMIIALPIGQEAAG